MSAKNAVPSPLHELALCHRMSILVGITLRQFLIDLLLLLGHIVELRPKVKVFGAIELGSKVSGTIRIQINR